MRINFGSINASATSTMKNRVDELSRGKDSHVSVSTQFILLALPCLPKKIGLILNV